MCFQMSTESTWDPWVVACIVTLVAFLGLSPMCIFNILSERMQNHIDCKCLTFLKCFFSVSSNGLPEKMQNYTGCICLTFLHCVFSSVSLNCLPDKMHNHIVCICLSSLHGVILNVFSNSIHEQMYDHTCCTHLTFPYYFQTPLQI